LADLLSDNPSTPSARNPSPSKIQISDLALDAEAPLDEAPRTTRKATATRRIPKKEEPKLSPEEQELFERQAAAALRAAQLGGRSEPRQGSGRIALAVLAGLALGAGGVFAYYRHVSAHPLPDAAETVAPVDDANQSAGDTPPSATNASSDPALMRGDLRIMPTDAEVVVDGQPVATPRGVLTLAGPEGSSFDVTIAALGKKVTTTVLMTDRGPDPTHVELPDEAAPEEAVPDKPAPDEAVPDKPAPRRPGPRWVPPPKSQPKSQPKALPQPATQPKVAPAPTNHPDDIYE
jgi:hypothetical protein